MWLVIIIGLVHATPDEKIKVNYVQAGTYKLQSECLAAATLIEMLDTKIRTICIPKSECTERLCP
jgi:hypothetical protein